MWERQTQELTFWGISSLTWVVRNAQRLADQSYSNWNVSSVPISSWLAVTSTPCLTDTYFKFNAATNEACGKESSNENSSSRVTDCERDFKTAFDPIGDKYEPWLKREEYSMKKMNWQKIALKKEQRTYRSRRARWPLWYSALNRHSGVQYNSNFPFEFKYLTMKINTICN